MPSGRELGSRIFQCLRSTDAATLGKAAGESAWESGHRGLTQYSALLHVSLVFLGMSLSLTSLAFLEEPLLASSLCYTAFRSSHGIYCMSILGMTLFMGSVGRISVGSSFLSRETVSHASLPD